MSEKVFLDLRTWPWEPCHICEKIEEATQGLPFCDGEIVNPNIHKHAYFTVCKDCYDKHEIPGSG